MTKEELKQIVLAAIDKERDAIVSLGREVALRPELGFKETQTAALVSKTLRELGLSCEEGLAVTGVKSRLSGRSKGPTVGVFGELDAIKCPSHPKADPDTGAAHACGHAYQIGALLGVAIALTKSGAMAHLDGDVALLAVPAEEMVELEFRAGLKRAGKIKYLSGKQEFLRIGALDDVDMTMMVHAYPNQPEPVSYIHGSSLGSLSKTIRYIGREAHASRPSEGINALNAATLALSAIHMHRETFRDEDSIRVHPIITKGGDLVNVVPADVRIETYVRGKSVEGMLAANEKVDRALFGASAIIGTSIVMEQTPGYLPMAQSGGMGDLFGANAASLYGIGSIVEGQDSIGSTDMGDVSQVIPSIQPSMGGFNGTLHGTDFSVADEEAAQLGPVRVMAMTIIDLLWDNAAAARDIIALEPPRLTKEAYFELLDGLTVTRSE